MKKILTLLPVILLTTWLGCGGKQEVRKPTIAYTPLTLSNPFFKVIGEHIKAEAEKNGYETLMVDPDMDVKKQSDQKKGHLHKPENSLIEEPTKQKDDSSIRINVEGMVCSFCAQGISKAFEQEGAVKSVRINLDDKTVNVKLKRFRRMSDKKI